MTEDQADELLAQLKAINESLARIAAALEKPASVRSTVHHSTCAQGPAAHVATLLRHLAKLA